VGWYDAGLRELYVDSCWFKLCGAAGAIAAVASTCVAPGSAPPPAVAPWEHVHRWLREARDRMAHDLETAHAALLARAVAAEEAELVRRLRPEPPRVRSRGYGILPEIVEDTPARAVESGQRVYSLETLGPDYAPDLRDAAVLAARVASEAGLPLAPWVAELERLRERLADFEDHLDYHAAWQVAVVGHRDWFQQRNRLADRVQQLFDLERQSKPPAEVGAVRRDLLAVIAPFRPTEGLRVERRARGVRVLAIDVWTDVVDPPFLETVRRAVERAYSDSAAAGVRRLALELHFRRIGAGELYGGRPPRPGDTIDLDDHLSRFPAGTLVMTTGAASTHAMTGRAVLLGPGPVQPRTLAHEFGHLLGFDDAYLRSYRGDPGGAFGAELIEWIGLSDDLMGNPQGGVVGLEMIDKLLEAYGDGSSAAADVE